MSADSEWLTHAFPLLSNLEPLKTGGQKRVFRCVHRTHGLLVLKVLHQGRDRYVERELEAVRRLQELSPTSVPRILEVGIVVSPVGPMIWLLEQYIDGIGLSEKLRTGPLRKRELLRLALDLVSAAAAAESVRMVHRDIKPDNVKIDSQGKAWLLDFGIVRILDLESMTPTNAISGPHTPGYAPPEQFDYRKCDIDGRSDLFAIGVVLYEAATGTNPFTSGATGVEILQRVMNNPLPELHLDWDLGGRLNDYIQALTQKQPYQRPRNCTDALAWVKDIISDLGE